MSSTVPLFSSRYLFSSFTLHFILFLLSLSPSFSPHYSPFLSFLLSLCSLPYLHTSAILLWTSSFFIPFCLSFHFTLPFISPFLSFHPSFHFTLPFILPFLSWFHPSFLRIMSSVSSSLHLIFFICSLFPFTILFNPFPPFHWPLVVYSNEFAPPPAHYSAKWTCRPT